MNIEEQAKAFVARWRGVTASELSTAQTFVIELCELLDVPRPHATADQDYMFERSITFVRGDGSTSAGRIDCYRRGHFVWESKKLKPGKSAPGKGFDDAMMRARQQAENYARALPAGEGRPPFLAVVDVGHVIELYSEFTRSGATYTPFPDPRSHRIRLEQLVDPAIRARLRALWLDPFSLDPSRISAKVTRQVAAELAELARSLESSGHKPEKVAGFLTRCLFSMFAEDVGLLPSADTTGSEGEGSFISLLRRYREQPDTLVQMLRIFWQAMDAGGFNAAIAKSVLRFNGKLFKDAGADGYALPLTTAQIDGLLRAAGANWTEVEPAIFGTLLERALDPTERHALGAHYTPRAYVERLVLPTVVEPLRADWTHAQAAAVLLAREADELEGRKREAKLAEARAEVRRFHHQLCTTRVLDPACGSGNFLYVTLEHLKRLEGEVLDQLEQLGETQDRLGLEGETVTLQQLRGIELNARAAALAELVLWIGWLQWHVRTRGLGSVAEPVVHDYGNIENRDAVLAYVRAEPAQDAAGKTITRWDGVTFKKHPVTNEDVPDEAAQVVQWKYVNPRQAEWPAAVFIVGNPPFIGNKRMRDALGDGYVEALRTAWPEVPESADLVMYWWHKAAETVRLGQAERFGFITTNSLTMIFNRRVIEMHQTATPPLSLAYSVPDHPWVDSTDGAAVRISMSVGIRGTIEGNLQTVVHEREADGGEVTVELNSRKGVIHADLKVGANVAGAKRLQANDRLSNRGVIPHGAGFIVTPNEARSLGLGTVPGLDLHIRPYRNGRDLTGKARGVLVIDLFGHQADDVRQRFPAVYQWLLERVKPERDQNPERSRRENWWLFARPNTELRGALAGLSRYIVTGQVAKHRVFQWLDASILPDDKLIAVASADALHLGVLSSSVHGAWALAAGGLLEDRPVYSKSTCFEAFPFPDVDSTGELAGRIRALAEQVDAHRKARQAAHTDATLTATYNVLEKLRSGEALTAKEKVVHEHGLVGVLKSLHDELDAAVLEAYGWSDLVLPTDADELLERLVALNTRRAAEEAAGTVRWLRPEFQDPARRAAGAPQQTGIEGVETSAEAAAREQESEESPDTTAAPAAVAAQPWPSSLPEQMRAVAQLLLASPVPLSLSAIEAGFKGKGPWKKGLPRILETLEVLGRANSMDEGWRSNV